MEEDERREAALRTSAALQPNFKSRCVTEDQLKKLKELHRKRLQIKAKSSKICKDLKGIAKEHKMEISSNKIKNEDTSSIVEDSCISTMKENSDISPAQQDKAVSSTSLGTKKRQKLHWGLDTKERWERKANM